MTGDGLLVTIGSANVLTFCQSLIGFRGSASVEGVISGFPRLRSLAKARRAIQTALGLQAR